jgi:hypothetical protein
LQLVPAVGGKILIPVFRKWSIQILKSSEPENLEPKEQKVTPPFPILNRFRDETWLVIQGISQAN